MPRGKSIDVSAVCSQARAFLFSIQELCTAKGLSRSGRSAAKVDDAIRHGFDWLIKVIYENHEALHKRVEKDVQARDAAQQKEKRERQERVKKAREE